MCVQQLRSASSALQRHGVLDDDMREEIIKCIGALTGHCLSLCPPEKSLESAAALTSSFVRQILSAMDLRNRGCLKRHAKKFILCFPEALRPPLEIWTDKAMASKSKLNRGQLFLDIAMLVFHHQRLCKLGPTYRYAWGDASTKGDLEVYNVRYRYLPQSEAVALARSWKWLCLHEPEGFCWQVFFGIFHQNV